MNSTVKSRAETAIPVYGAPMVNCAFANTFVILPLFETRRCRTTSGSGTNVSFHAVTARRATIQLNTLWIYEGSSSVAMRFRK